MNNYQADGIGTGFLPRPALQFLLTSDPFLGTSVPGVPDGPFNRELYKLLENDSALANALMGYLAKTHGVSSSAAPSVNTVPNPLTGAPSTPANLAVHVVYYTNFEVSYRFNGASGLWVELARITRTYNVYQKHTKKITVQLVDGETNISVTLPTTDSTGAAFAFTLDDLKIFYINNLDDESPVLSVLPGLSVFGTVIRVLCTTAPIEGSNYQLVMVFEHVTTT
jgi:hypothetical protein